MAAAGGGGTTFTDILLTVFTTQGLSGYQASMNQAAVAANQVANAQAVLNSTQLQAALSTQQLAMVQGILVQGQGQLAAAQRNMASQMQQASLAVLGLAASFSGLGQAMYPVFFAFYRAGAQTQFLVAVLLTLMGVVKKTSEAFMEFEQTSFQLGAALAQSGFGDSIQMWRDYADARQNATGIDREATMALSAQLIQLRFTREEVLKLVPAIQAAALARANASGGRINPAAMASQIAKGVAMGEEAQLLELGLDVGKIKRAADRVAEIHRQLIEKFGAAQEAYMETTFGQQTRLASEWQRFTSEIGASLSPLVSLLEKIAIGLVHSAEGWLYILRALGPLVNIFSGLLPNPLANTDKILDEESRRNQGRMVDHLRSIDNKMDQFTTTMARAVLGGTGARIREAATIRNFTPLARQRF